MLDKAEMARWERLTDAMLAHAAEDDPEAFAQVVGLVDRARARLPQVAHRLRLVGDRPGEPDACGYSWGELAKALGISRQAAQQRFGRA